MFTPSRNEARQFMFETWHKYRAGQPLAGLEQVALKVMLLHPEYHALLDQPDRFIERDYTPDGGGLNPFLHLSLHIAVEEQLAIGHPAGIRLHFERITAATGSQHDAMHAVIECLAETLWQAQRTATAPDEAAYVACLENRGRG